MPNKAINSYLDIKNNWGAFLLNKYGMMIGDKALATYHLDFRSSRGVAGGLDLKSQKHKNNEHFGHFKSYYANDQGHITNS